MTSTPASRHWPTRAIAEEYATPELTSIGPPGTPHPLAPGETLLASTEIEIAILINRDGTMTSAEPVAPEVAELLGLVDYHDPIPLPNEHQK